MMYDGLRDFLFCRLLLSQSSFQLAVFSYDLFVLISECLFVILIRVGQIWFFMTPIFFIVFCLDYVGISVLVELLRVSRFTFWIESGVWFLWSCE